jgi:hypothetical protein
VVDCRKEGIIEGEWKAITQRGVEGKIRLWIHHRREALDRERNSSR